MLCGRKLGLRAEQAEWDRRISSPSAGDQPQPDSEIYSNPPPATPTGRSRSPAPARSPPTSPLPPQPSGPSQTRNPPGHSPPPPVHLPGAFPQCISRVHSSKNPPTHPQNSHTRTIAESPGAASEIPGYSRSIFPRSDSAAQGGLSGIPAGFGRCWGGRHRSHRNFGVGTESCPRGSGWSTPATGPLTEDRFRRWGVPLAENAHQDDSGATGQPAR